VQLCFHVAQQLLEIGFCRDIAHKTNDR
jgi:hypothetical protein